MAKYGYTLVGGKRRFLWAPRKEEGPEEGMEDHSGMSLSEHVSYTEDKIEYLRAINVAPVIIDNEVEVLKKLRKEVI